MNLAQNISALESINANDRATRAGLYDQLGAIYGDLARSDIIKKYKVKGIKDQLSETMATLHHTLGVGKTYHRRHHPINRYIRRRTIRKPRRY